MLGFDAIGRLSLGQLPEPSAAPAAQTFVAGPSWAGPLKKAGLSIAVLATSFGGFVPPPPAQAAQVFTRFSEPVHKPSIIDRSWQFAPPPAQTQTAIFSKFSEPLRARATLPDEQPSALFEVLPPQAPPFTGFARFELPIQAKANVALFTGPANVIFVPPTADTHDGVWVKRKKRREGPEPLDLELEERAKRRAAIELAVYGPPELTYELPPSPIAAPPVPPPNTEGLTRVIMQIKAKEIEAQRNAAAQDDEDILEMILRDIS